jgi:hypothetical protein
MLALPRSFASGAPGASVDARLNLDAAGTDVRGVAKGEAERLERVFAAIVEQVRRDAGFAQRLRDALGEVPSPTPAGSEPPRRESAPPTTSRPPPPPPAPRREKALIDPFALYDTGWESMLSEHLERLSVEQLRDVIHQYRMDPAARTASLSDIEELRAWIIRAVENFGIR